MKRINVCRRFYVSAVGVVTLLGSTVASAAIDAGLHLVPIGNEIQDDALTVFTWVLPIIGTIMAMTIGIKLFKRFTRAT